MAINLGVKKIHIPTEKNNTTVKAKAAPSLPPAVPKTTTKTITNIKAYTIYATVKPIAVFLAVVKSVIGTWLFLFLLKKYAKSIT